MIEHGIDHRASGPIRLVVVDRACPEPDSSGVVPDDDVDGSLRVVIYKSPRLRARGSENYDAAGLLAYSKGRRALVVLDLLATPELIGAFEDAMSDLHARPVFDNT